MPRISKWVLPVVFVLVILIVVLGFTLPFFVKPDFLSNLLSEAVQKNSDYLLSVENPKFSVFPVPSFEFSDVKLWAKRETGKTGTSEPVVTAQKIRCLLSPYPLLFKKIAFSKIEVDNADFEYQGIQMTGAKIKLENVGSLQWIKIQADGKWLQNKSNVSLKGRFKANFDKFNLNQAAFQMQVSLQSVSIFELAGIWLPQWTAQIQRGTVRAGLDFNKEENQSTVLVNGEIDLRDFIYHSQKDTALLSAPGQYKLDFENSYDIDSQIVNVKRMDLSTPFAKFLVKGSFDAKASQLENVQVSSSQIVLDNLHTFILPLADLMPVNFGFSGEAQMELRARGTLSQLKMNGQMNLTNALLTYSKYFVKSKGTSFLIMSDEMMLRHGTELDGGIDVQLKDIKMKGSLVKYDLAKKTGEITFVTNLIPLEGAEEYFPTLSEYKLRGNVKLFANAKGNFEAPGVLIGMGHVAFNDVAAESKTGAPLLQKLNGKVDAGPFEVETGGIQLDFGNTHFNIQAKMFLQKTKPVLVQIESPAFDIRNFVLQMRKVFQVMQIPDTFSESDAASLPKSAPRIERERKTVDWEGIEKSIQGFVQPDAKLENFILELGYENKEWTIRKLEFNIYGGHVSFMGSLKLGEDEPLYQVALEVNRLSLAKMLRRDVRTPAEGNLFLALQAGGEGFSKEMFRSNLKGEGSVSITNGEFHTFDVLGSLGTIAQLVGLGNYVSGTTRFSDFNGKFLIANGKVQTEHIFLHSDDFDIDSAGEIDFLEGNLNFRLDTVLSNTLSRKIDSSLTENDRMGPIPLLLSGKIDSPSLRPDPSLIKDFVQNLISGKLGKILADQGFFKPSQTSNQAPAGQNRSDQRPGDGLAETGMTLLESLFQKRE